MDIQVKLLKKIWKTSLALLVSAVIVVAGLYLNLTNSFATSTPPAFPSCNSMTSNGDWAHYDSGTHQIPGDGLLTGSDDVYSLGNNNFLQCYRNNEICIQSNWWRTDLTEYAGWMNLNGEVWNLGNFNYLVKNVTCEVPPSPSPSPTPEASPSPTPVVISGGGQAQSQSQTQENNQEVNVVVTQAAAPQVAGVKVPTKAPETGVGVLGLASMLSVGPLGVALRRYSRKNSTQKEESLGELASGIFDNRNSKLS